MSNFCPYKWKHNGCSYCLTTWGDNTNEEIDDLMILGFVLLLAACSTQNKNNKSQEIPSVKIELIKRQNLDHWKLALIPRANSFDRQYDIEAQKNFQVKL
jgi:hypothetical protein